MSLGLDRTTLPMEELLAAQDLGGLSVPLDTAFTEGALAPLAASVRLPPASIATSTANGASR